MFSSTGYFRSVPCPQRHNCSLTNCFFNHNSEPEVPNGATATKNEVYDPLSAGEIEPPPLKKRRLESPEQESQKRRRNEIQVETLTSSTSLVPTPINQPNHEEPPRQSQGRSSVTAIPPKTARPLVKPSSTTRAVSPPPRQHAKPIQALQGEKLMPRQVARAPVQLNSRMTCLKLIHDAYKDQNARMREASGEQEGLLLLDQEVIKLALDDEQEVANAAASAEIYRNVIAQKVLRAKKMSSEDWRRLVMEKFRGQMKQIQGSKEVEIKTGLQEAQEIDILRGLKTAVAGLESHGYVTGAPTAAEIQKSKSGIALAAGYETCDRCSRRFQVFPGRDDEGRLTTQGTCYYHWAKVQRAQPTKVARMTGQADGSYPCCGKMPGSEGCTKAGTHVFKVSDPKRLASLLQFEKTPLQNDGKKRSPVAFDCEMAYTTYGMELIRVTAISWPGNQGLLDVLVRPYGEILDMNTRFSGVSNEQFASSQVFDPRRAQTGDGGSSSLMKVESPAAARQMMFDLLTPDTPLIGHAIENDLNACRMIHPFIVDTVLLYPHPRGLPFRFGLKMLAIKYLGRSIQSAGEQGHDSKEDSVATGDLVRVKVAEKWKNMQLQGWKFQDGRLILRAR